MPYIGNKPADAILTTDQIADGAITGSDLAAGAALANLGFTPASSSVLSAHIGTGGAAHANAVAAGAAGFMSGADKTKLDGIAIGATNYTHPANHPPSIITQDASNRFVTDAEKTAWNAKEATITAGTTAQYYRGDKSWQTLDKTAVALGNVDNTSDATKNAATATLTNKTLTAPVITGYTETVYNLTGTAIDPANGTIQYKTLSGNTTFTESLADGQSVVLMLNPATYTTTWPTATWIGSAASAAPTLVASVYNCITFFQIGGTLYGKYEGRV